VPVKSLFDYLEGGHTIDYFLLEQFLSVRREQVMGVLESARSGAERDAFAAARS